MLKPSLSTEKAFVLVTCSQWVISSINRAKQLLKVSHAYCMEPLDRGLPFFAQQMLMQKSLLEIRPTYNTSSLYVAIPSFSNPNQYEVKSSALQLCQGSANGHVDLVIVKVLCRIPFSFILRHFRWHQVARKQAFLSSRENGRLLSSSSNSKNLQRPSDSLSLSWQWGGWDVPA